MRAEAGWAEAGWAEAGWARVVVVRVVVLQAAVAVTVGEVTVAEGLAEVATEAVATVAVARVVVARAAAVTVEEVTVAGGLAGVTEAVAMGGAATAGAAAGTAPQRTRLPQLIGSGGWSGGWRCCTPMALSVPWWGTPEGTGCTNRFAGSSCWGSNTRPVGRHQARTPHRDQCMWYPVETGAPAAASAALAFLGPAPAPFAPQPAPFAPQRAATQPTTAALERSACARGDRHFIPWAGVSSGGDTQPKGHGVRAVYPSAAVEASRLPRRRSGGAVQVPAYLSCHPTPSTAERRVRPSLPQTGAGN